MFVKSNQVYTVRMYNNRKSTVRIKEVVSLFIWKVVAGSCLKRISLFNVLSKVFMVQTSALEGGVKRQLSQKEGRRDMI